MTLLDFKEPIIPFNKWGNDTDEKQIREWHVAGFLITNMTRPDYLVDRFALTAKGHLHATGIDKTRWPYICGVFDRNAKRLGKELKDHGLEVGTDCYRHYMAGLESND